LRARRSNLRGALPRGQTVPLPMLRVARIVPEFCAHERPENRATPCAQRNKEFFTRGVFYLLDCCTNVVVCRAGSAHHPAGNSSPTADPVLSRVEGGAQRKSQIVNHKSRGYRLPTTGISTTEGTETEGGGQMTEGRGRRLSLCGYQRGGVGWPWPTDTLVPPAAEIARAGGPHSPPAHGSVGQAPVPALGGRPQGVAPTGVPRRLGCSRTAPHSDQRRVCCPSLSRWSA